MTKQQAVNKSFQFVMEHGLSMDYSGCVMRTADGRRCAIGSLLPASYWGVGQASYGEKQFEAITGLKHADCGVIGTPASKAAKFLSDLQDCHDNAGDLAVFAKNIKNLCKAEGLKFPGDKS